VVKKINFNHKKKIMFYIFLLFVLLLVFYQSLADKLMKPPKGYPNPSEILPNKRVLVCAGDSLTHGNIGYDWVSDLSAQLPEYQAFNAGINGDLSYTLLNRLDDIIAMKPHNVNILIGTNDIVAQSRPLKKNDSYFTMKKITWGTQPTLLTYEENLHKIITRLKQETTASISLMSIPPIGEDRQHPIYKTVDTYNKIVKNVADTEGVTYLPLHETMDNYLQKNNAQSHIPFEETKNFILKSAIMNVFLQWDWDKITQRHKHLLTFDNLHFNSKGGQMIGELLVKHLKNQ
jgi:lysophospholipase L1-like esterase